MSKRRPKLVIRKQPLPEDAFPERDVRQTREGGVAEVPIRKVDERRERAAFGSAKRRRVHPPAWFLELARSRAAPAKVIETLKKRLPEIKDLEVVRLIINEMGRLETAADVLRRNLTPEGVRRLHRKG